MAGIFLFCYDIWRGSTLRVYLYAVKNTANRRNTLRVYLYAVRGTADRRNTLRVYLYAVKNTADRRKDGRTYERRETESRLFRGSAGLYGDLGSAAVLAGKAT